MPAKTLPEFPVGRYMDLKTDFSFKHIFRSEPHKDILIQFLNDLLEGQRVVQDIEFRSVEEIGDTVDGRGVTYDLRCRGENGEEFLVELQRATQAYFKDRILFYLSRLVSRLLPKGIESDSYKLPEVYVILIVDFRIEEDVKDRYLRTVAFTDLESNKVFYDKLYLKWLELPNFDKKHGPEITNNLDKWMWLFKNLGKANKIPFFMDSRVLKKVFKIAEIAGLTEEQRMAYEGSIRQQMEVKNAILYERERAEKFEAKHLEAIRFIKKEGLLDNKQIAEKFDIPLEIVEAL